MRSIRCSLACSLMYVLPPSNLILLPLVLCFPPPLSFTSSLPSYLHQSILLLLPPPPSPFLTSASSAGYHCTLTQTITSSSRTMISGSDQPPSPSAIPPPPVCRFVITGVGFGIIEAQHNLLPPREVSGSGVVGIVCFLCVCVCVCVKEISI